MGSLTFTRNEVANRQDGQTGWVSNNTAYTNAARYIRVLFNNNHFSKIPSNAKIDSIVISFTATAFLSPKTS